MSRAIITAIVPLLLVGCNIKENAHLQSQVDSLTVELEASARMTDALREVGVLLDSIDSNRELIRVSMEQGTTYSDFETRMGELNKYVQETEDKIAALENSLQDSRGAVGAYAGLIRKLKADFEARSEEITRLQDRVEKYRNENQNLISIIGLQDAEISDKEAQIREKEQELALIEAKIQEVLVQSKMSEADAYFARAQATEEAAIRTKLAPRKKRETLKEAIELYKKALALGRKDAQAKIDKLNEDM